MRDFLSEEERVEQLKQWWKENGRFVLVGAAFGVVLIVGYRYWKHYRLEQSRAASAIAEELYQALDKREFNEVQARAETLDKEYRSTSYDELAYLALARIQVEQQEFDQAITSLQTVLERSKDDKLKALTRTRLASLWLQTEQPEKALEVLKVEMGTSFTARYQELRGDAYLALGDTEKARQAYQAALATVDVGGIDRDLVTLKLQDLPPVTPVIEKEEEILPLTTTTPNEATQ